MGETKQIIFYWGTGRRKTAVARVRIRPGKGRVVVNKRPLEEYFVLEGDRRLALQPVASSGRGEKYDIFVNVRGGGFHGQAGAVELGLARALVKAEPELEKELRDHGMLTRDPRMRERKKYGKKGARASFQFSKR